MSFVLVHELTGSLMYNLFFCYSLCLAASWQKLYAEARMLCYAIRLVKSLLGDKEMSPVGIVQDVHIWWCENLHISACFVMIILE